MGKWLDILQAKAAELRQPSAAPGDDELPPLASDAGELPPLPRPAEPATAKDPDEGWERLTAGQVRCWVRKGLKAADRAAALRLVNFHEPAGNAAAILICKPGGAATVERKRCNSCGAEIFWVSTVQGKSMPLDPEPAAHGNVILQQGGTLARILGAEALAGLNDSVPRFLSHFSTCPNASRHRRAK